MTSPKRSNPNPLPTGNILYSLNHMVGSNADPLKNIPCSPPEKRRVAASRSKLTQSPKCKSSIALSAHEQSSPREKHPRPGRQIAHCGRVGDFRLCALTIQRGQNFEKQLVRQAAVRPQDGERAANRAQSLRQR